MTGGGIGRMLAAMSLLLGLAACGDGSGTFQGYVEGDFLLIGAQQGGRVVRLDVAEGSEVKAGDPLFALDDTAQQADLRAAQDAVTAAEARLADAKNGAREQEIEALIAQRQQAQASLKLSQLQFDRQQRLVNSGTRPPEMLDEARAALQRDQAGLDEINKQIEVAKLGSRVNQVEAAAAEAMGAEAALDKAQWQLDERQVKAPLSGRVTEIVARQGEVMQEGAPVVMLLPPRNLKIRFYMPEAMMATIKQGSDVVVSCDGCAEEVQAKVSFVASEVEFTPPVIFSDETRQKLVIMGEARPVRPVDFLRPGQPVTVRSASSSKNASADARTGH
jgi:HlyD family secretion protein